MSGVSDDREKWSAELDALNEAIATHPGMLAQARRQEVERSLNIFERNALELVGLLSDVETNDDLVRALFAQPGGDSEDMRTDYYQQLDQRLANFVSSLAALVDNTRGPIGFYKETDCPVRSASPFWRTASERRECGCGVGARLRCLIAMG